MLIAANLFAAGRETTARLLGTALRSSASAPSSSSGCATTESHPAVHRGDAAAREPDPGRIPAARVPDEVGGVDLPAGTTLMVLNGAANRDPRQFADPDELPPRPRRTGASTSGSGSASTPARARRSPRRGPRQPRAHARPHDRHQDLRGASTARPAPAATSTRRSTCSAVSSACTSSSRPSVTAVRRGSGGAPCRATSSSATSCARGWRSTRRPRSRSRRRPTTPTMLREWQRTLHAGRWVGIHWPVEYGGRGASLTQVAIYNEELARAGAPPLLGRAGVTPRRADADGARHRGAARAVDAADPRRPTTSGASCSASPARAATSPRLSTRAEKRGGVYRRDRPEGVVVVRDASPTWASRSCAPTPTRRRTRASRCSRSRWTRRASTCARCAR